MCGGGLRGLGLCWGVRAWEEYYQNGVEMKMVRNRSGGDILGEW